MGKLEITTDPRVDEAFAKYPSPFRKKMQRPREMVIETTEEILLHIPGTTR